VQSLAFNREGTLLASGGFQVVKLWERPQNVQLNKFALDGPVTVSAVSADRKLLAVATGKSVQLYDLTTGKPAAKLEGHAENVAALAFSPDSAKLFTGSADKTVRVWTVADGKEQGKLETPQPVAALTVVGDGSKIATGGGDAVIRLWNIADLSKPAAELLEKELTGHSQPVTSLITQPNAPTQIVSGSTDGTVRQWSTESSAARTLNHGGPVVAVAISPDGQKLVSASPNKIAKLWNATNGQQIAEVKGDLRAQKVVAQLTADVALAQAVVNEAKAAVEAAKKDAPTKAEAAKKAQDAVAAAEKEVKAKQEPADKAKAANEAATKTLAEADEAVKKATEAAEKAKEALDKDADNEDLKKAKAAADKALADAQAKQKDATTKLEATKKPLEDAEKALTDAKRSLDSAQKALELAQNDLKKAEEAIPTSEKQLETAEAGLKKQQEALAAAQKTVTDSEQPWQAVAFSADGSEFAVAGDDKLVHTYAAADGKALDVLVGHDGVIRSLVYAGPSQIVSAADDKAAIVWETNPEWKLVRTIGTGDTPLVDRVIALDFSPDGKLLATGGGEPSRSGEVKIWNVADGKLVRDLTDAHSDTVFSVKFSPQGDMLASGAADKFLKVWNVGSGELFRSYEGHTHHVLGVSWKFDSKVLATAGADQVIKVWDVATGEQKRTITGFAKQLTAIEFVATTPEVVAAGGDKQVHRRNVDSGGAVRTYSGGTDYMYTVAVSADGTLVIAGGEDSALRVWKGADGAAVHTFQPPKDEKADGATAAK
jgi:WD40 repeat protein